MDELRVGDDRTVAILGPRLLYVKAQADKLKKVAHRWAVLAMGLEKD